MKKQSKYEDIYKKYELLKLKRKELSGDELLKTYFKLKNERR